jgi:hypothetical protein
MRGRVNHSLSRQGAPTENDRQILDYAPPAGSSRLAALAKAGGIRLALGVVLFVAAIALPHPHGIWYFGGHPRWLVAIDVQGLEIGPSSHPALLGWIPLVVLKMLVVGAPVWLVWRYLFRARRRGPSAG